MNNISILAIIGVIAVIGITAAITVTGIESDSTTPEIADTPSELIITEDESGAKHYSASISDSVGITVNGNP